VVSRGESRPGFRRGASERQVCPRARQTSCHTMRLHKPLWQVLLMVLAVAGVPWQPCALCSSLFRGVTCQCKRGPLPGVPQKSMCTSDMQGCALMLWYLRETERQFWSL